MLGDNQLCEIIRRLKASEQKQFGKFRAGRLVLAAWDRVHTGELQPC